MKRFWLALAWLAATGITTLATWQVVGAVEDRVADDPLAPVIALPAEPETTTTVAPGSTTPPTTASTTTPSTSPTTAPSSTTPATTHPPEPSGTTTTAPTTTTTTTTAPESATQRVSIPTAGGVLVVDHDGETVRLVSATPALGYSAEIERAGPDEVKVEFRLENAELEVTVKVEDGRLVTDVRAKD